MFRAVAYQATVALCQIIGCGSVSAVNADSRFYASVRAGHMHRPYPQHVQHVTRACARAQATELEDYNHTLRPHRLQSESAETQRI